MTHLTTSLLIGTAVFIAVCIYGIRTAHRTFMHSILAGVILYFSLRCFCYPLSKPFSIGFASHLILDFFNRKKVQYLWPIPWRIGLNKYPSDGKLNNVLGGLGTVGSIFMGAYYLIRSFSYSSLYERAFTFFATPVAIMGRSYPMLVPYLIVINIITLIIYSVDYNLAIRGLGFYSGSEEQADAMSEFNMTLLLLVDYTGGFIGMLIVVLITQTGKFSKAKRSANFNLFILPLCILISWTSILFTFFFPKVMSWIRPLGALYIGEVPIQLIILGYLLTINLITLFLFPRVQQFANVITLREKISLVLCLLGGATGGYLVPAE